MNCPLCDSVGGVLLVEMPRYRVIRAEDPDYPGFCRVVWRAHVKEMTDLSPAEQSEFMHAVLSVERVLRALYAPDKINLASLGNRVSHLHWHVIARSQDDRHFPEAVWAAPVRDSRVIWPKVEDDPLRAALLQALTQGAPIAS